MTRQAAQHEVCVADVSCPFGGQLVAGVEIGVMLADKPTVCAADLILSGSRFELEDRVVVDERHALLLLLDDGA